MSLVNNRLPQKRLVSVRPMTRDDLGRLTERRAQIGTPKKLRQSHHNIARFAAAGLRNKEIGERIGMTPERVGTLRNVPAMVELIAHYTARIDETFIDSVEAYYELATTNMIAAERHIADRIADLDEDDELLPIRDALAISRDAADRFGYGKKSTNLNVNVDFASRLEEAIKRSGKSLTESVAAVDILPSKANGSVNGGGGVHQGAPSSTTSSIRRI